MMTKEIITIFNKMNKPFRRKMLCSRYCKVLTFCDIFELIHGIVLVVLDIKYVHTIR